MLNHPYLIEKLGANLQKYIARFLTDDSVMLKAMTRRQRSIYSDPVFQIEWYFWELPRETDATLDAPNMGRSDTDDTLDDPKITHVFSTAETPAGFALINTADTPWLDPRL